MLGELHKAYQDWESLLNQIEPTRFEEPGVNGLWSIKDLVSHLTAWNINLVVNLSVAYQNEVEPTPHWPAKLQSEDEINGWIYESKRKRTTQVVMDEMRKVHQTLIWIIQSLPDDVRIERLEGKLLVVWLGGTRFHVSEFFDNFQDDHEPDVLTGLTGKQKPKKMKFNEKACC